MSLRSINIRPYFPRPASSPRPSTRLHSQLSSKQACPGSQSHKQYHSHRQYAFLASSLLDLQSSLFQSPRLCIHSPHDTLSFVSHRLSFNPIRSPRYPHRLHSIHPASPISTSRQASATTSRSTRPDQDPHSQSDSIHCAPRRVSYHFHPEPTVSHSTLNAHSPSCSTHSRSSSLAVP